MAFNLFNSIRVTKPKRHAFDLSHDVKLSCNLGNLIPIMCEDVVPGDTFKVTTEILMRFAPLVSPVMHSMNVYTHFFFVPKRLVWDGWKDFITGGEHRPSKKDPNDAPAYPIVYPTEAFTKNPSNNLLGIGSLADYLGFPVGHDGDQSMKIYGITSSEVQPIDLLPFRAYHLIWNEYYRDQNLQDPVDIGTEYSGEVNASEAQALFSLHNRAWEKDYFTSALPWPQAGEDVLLPLHGDATVDIPEGEVTVNRAHKSFSGKGVGVGSTVVSNGSRDDVNLGSIRLGSSIVTEDNLSLEGRAVFNTPGNVDLSNVTAATINELRRAVKAQEFLEVSARGGSRYIEQLLSFFGVHSSDGRLQRPEYLGGGKSPVVISDVTQTSQTEQTGTPQGNLSGQAASLQKSHSFKRYFEEHGYIIGIMSVLPRTAYMQGLPRKFTKFTREDHYWPQFAHLGEQEIKNKEIYLRADGEGDKTFGYTPRYAEYKYLPSRICGDFRDTLSYWHMGRIFNSRPNLNGDFVTFKGDNRIFADTNDDYQKLWVNIYHNITAVRPMPVYGTPMF